VFVIRRASALRVDLFTRPNVLFRAQQQLRAVKSTGDLRQSRNRDQVRPDDPGEGIPLAERVQNRWIPEGLSSEGDDRAPRLHTNVVWI
jgi:hypothetical protein